jgi:hypothetical protein
MGPAASPRALRNPRAAVLVLERSYRPPVPATGSPPRPGAAGSAREGGPCPPAGLRAREQFTSEPRPSRRAPGFASEPSPRRPHSTVRARKGTRFGGVDATVLEGRRAVRGAPRESGPCGRASRPSLWRSSRRSEASRTSVRTSRMSLRTSRPGARASRTSVRPPRASIAIPDTLDAFSVEHPDPGPVTQAVPPSLQADGVEGPDLPRAASLSPPERRYIPERPEFPRPSLPHGSQEGPCARFR